MSADITELLRAYRASRALAERPPASITLPGRSPVSRWLRAIHRAIRPTWGTERWTTARVRRRVEALERALAERLALASPSGGDARTRDAVQHFKESLPAPPSRVLALGAFVAAVVLAQAIIGNLANVFADRFGEQPDLANALGSIGPTPDVNSASTLLRALGKANFELLFAFVVGVALSTYLVCRASSCGYRLAGLVLGRPDGLGAPRRGSDLAHATNTIDVPRLESSVFTELDAKPTRDFPFDLAVKALLAIALVFAGLYGQRSSLVGDEDRGWWIAVGAVGVARLLWLARASHARGDNVAWLGIPAAVLVATALAVSPGPVFGPDELPKDREFSLALSLSQNLSGADLRHRDLRLFHLFGKDLDGADLTGADLGGANLANARLRGADLTDADLFGTNLQNADLRGAVLDGTDFDAAQMCGADLRNTELDFIGGSPIFDSRTSWPGDGSPPPGAEQVSEC